MSQAFDKNTIMDNADQMGQVASSTIPLLLEFFKESSEKGAAVSLCTLSNFQAGIATRATELHHELRVAYLTGVRGPVPASPYLGLTRGVYEFVRKDLAVKMHGDENLAVFPNGIGVDNVSIGQNITKIYEVNFFFLFPVARNAFWLTVLIQAIRDGKFRGIIISLFLLDEIPADLD
jgi:phenylalanine ammonia-lyase